VNWYEMGKENGAVLESPPPPNIINPTDGIIDLILYFREFPCSPILSNVKTPLDSRRHRFGSKLSEDCIEVVLVG